MSDFSNELTLKQVEYLAVLAEECGETVQAIGKILRHGLLSFSPYDSECVTNKGHLEKEIGNLVASIGYLVPACGLSLPAIDASARSKLIELRRWLHHWEEGD